MVTTKDKIQAWKTFNPNTSNLGIVREPINLHVLQEKAGDLQMEELIDLALMVISDKAREFKMDLLNNAKNSLVDNFWSIKWILHELKDIKLRLGQADNLNSLQDQGNQANLADSIHQMDQRLKNVESIN